LSFVPPPDRPSTGRYVVLALCVAAVVAATIAVGRLESGGPAAAERAPAATLLALDVQGKVRLYGSHIPGIQSGAMAAVGDPTEPDEAHRRLPTLAIRLAALDLLSDDAESAQRLLEEAEGDEGLALLVQGLAAEPGSAKVAQAAEESSRLKPLWARRAFRLHLLDKAGDSEAVSREEGFIASEAVESLIGLIVVAAVVMVVLSLGLLLWIIGAPALVIWRLSRIEPPRPPDVPTDETQEESLPQEEPSTAPSPLTAGEVLVAFFATQVFAGMGYRALGIGPEFTPYALLAIYLVATLAASAVARWRMGPRVLAKAGFRRCPLWKLYVTPVVAALALPPVYILLALIVSEVVGETPQSTNPALSIMAGQEDWLGRLAMFLTVVVAAPLAEEGMFRGVLYSSLRSRIGAIGAIAITSVLFGLVHLDPLVAPMLILVGMATAILRELTDSLWPPAILHAIVNGGVTLMMFLLMG